MNKNTKAICLRIPIKHVDNLKKIARQTSLKKNKDISYSDLIRNLIREFIENDND
tara:strand:+ start:1600 stop:1764 length:165 start_codon:yes stop_codon:yes gene_type:complete